MDDTYLAKALRVLLDDEAPPAIETLDLSNAGTVDLAEAHLRDWFDEHPDHAAVAVVVAGELIGAVTARSLSEATGTAGEAPNGAGERLTLPAGSTQYRLLTFRCPACGDEAHRARYDARDLPACARDNTTMELVR